jgi:hypothetical protein
MNKYAIKDALESSETMGVVLFTILNRQYAEEWLEWDPATIYLELRADFDAEPSTSTMDRISALQVAIISGAFFTQIDAFTNICNTLASGAPAFAMFDPVTAGEAAWAFTELALVRDLIPVSYSIKSYIKIALRADGILDNPPDILQHVLKTSDPSGNVIKTMVPTTGEELQRGTVDEFIQDQLKDIVYQFSQLGLSGELHRLLEEKDLDDILK